MTRFDTASGNYWKATYVRPMPNGARTPLPSETVSLGPEGALRVPDRLRRLLGWQEGDKLVLTADDRGDLKILTVRDAVRVRGMLSEQTNGRLLRTS